MIPVQIRVTRKLIKMLDELIEKGVYSNRSEAIRDAIRKNVSYFNESEFLKNDE